MKKTIKIVLKHLLLVMLVSFCLNSVLAQTVVDVPNQISGNDYFGDPIIYKNDLYVSYNGHLAKCNGNQIIIIPNPDDLNGFIGNGNNIDIVYNNKLYFGYTGIKGSQLAEYDGISINLIPNPPNAISYYGCPVIYNNKLYIRYSISSTSFQLFEFDGNNFLPIENPSGTSLNFFLSINGGEASTYSNPIIYNNKLYLQYTIGTNDVQYQIGEFDGTNVNLLPLPVGANEYSLDPPTIFNNKIYFRALSTTTELYNLTEYDGVNPPHIISNPDNNGSVIANYESSSIVFQNKLYIAYLNGSNKLQLTQYDGSTLSLIPNPDEGAGYVGNPVINNDKLYFGYADVKGAGTLAQYDGSAISLIQNPPSFQNNPPFYNYTDQLTTYHNKLYLRYDGGTYQYDGVTLSPVATKFGHYGYNGNPIIVNDTLFFADVSLAHANYFAYLGDVTTLPLTIISFTVEAKKNDCLLSWQTATEENTNYFTIQRSIDGSSFTNIGKVFSAGNSNVIKSYTYIDNNASVLKENRLYYRLQEVDRNGSSTYSSIQTIGLVKSNFVFSVSPNPTKDFINIVSSNDVTDAQVKVTDMSGKTLYNTKQNFVAGQLLKVSLSRFPNAALLVTIVSNNDHEQFKIIRE